MPFTGAGGGKEGSAERYLDAVRSGTHVSELQRSILTTSSPLLRTHRALDKWNSELRQLTAVQSGHSLRFNSSALR